MNRADTNYLVKASELSVCLNRWNTFSMKSIQRQYLITFNLRACFTEPSHAVRAAAIVSVTHTDVDVRLSTEHGCILLVISGWAVPNVDALWSQALTKWPSATLISNIKCGRVWVRKSVPQPLSWADQKWQRGCTTLSSPRQISDRGHRD